MSGNQIHPTAIIGPHVSLGVGNTIGPYAVIVGRVDLGHENWIGPHASIGTPAQVRGGTHPSWDEAGEFGIQIGSRNVIREYVTIHEGTDRTTFVGDDCYFMTGSHVPHDAIIENGVTLANSVHLGGHTWIGAQANLGLGVQVHQHSAIGAGAMVGMNATVTRPIPPYALAIGSPATIRRANTVGMQRQSLPTEAIDTLDQHYREGHTHEPDPPIDVLSMAFDTYALHTPAQSTA